ncbi:interferon-induced 35 kDa protein isoform X2 [Bombina bombina]|nr:interferon-induced 35 kDa protein isoform X2 [Bombina bombina]XP_053555558.1 interferon-induced 35 kDa protein isoform X2 [Bombina bombina]
MTEEKLNRVMEKYQALKEDADSLEKVKLELESLTQKLNDRGDKMEKSIEQDKQELIEKQKISEKRVKLIWEENQQLLREQKNLEEQICQIQENKGKLDHILASGTERKMAFKGKLSDTIPENGLNIKHQIKKTIWGGTALITFENEEVATDIIRIKDHQIKVDDCHINVKAEPVELLVLDFLNVDMNISSQKIFVSNLPSSVPEDQLMDKLDIFFSKSKNGGGEVESVEILSEYRSAIITFTEDNVAPRLTKQKIFNVPLGNKNYEIHATPSLNGNLTACEVRNAICNRTIQITGIPDITEPDNLQDHLQMHFQKESNGGGEVLAIEYVPDGKRAVAIFEDD